MIEVRDLVKRYGRHLAVDHLSFTVPDGQIFGFLGPNGAGKSTTMNLMTCYLGPTEGEILVDGESVLGKKISEISRRVGSVLQNADSQIVHIRVEDEIAFGCENRNLPRTEIRNRVEEACRMMQLDKSWATQTLPEGRSSG